MHKFREWGRKGGKKRQSTMSLEFKHWQKTVLPKLGLRARARKKLKKKK